MCKNCRSNHAQGVMGDSSGEPELRLAPKFERKDKEILESGCTRGLLVNVHPVEPWVIFSPAGQSLQVWNCDDGTQVASWAIPDVNNDAYEAQFITQEDWIAVRRLCSLAIYDKQGSNLRCIKVLTGETYRMRTHAMAVHPTLPYLSAAFAQDDILLWRWGQGWEKIVLKGHSRWVYQVVFHPRESHIFASAGSDSTIKVWSLKTMSVLNTLEEDDHYGYIDEIGFGNGLHKSLLISSLDRCICVWDYESVAKWVPHKYNPISAFFHPRLPYIFTAADDGEIRVWSDSTYQQVSSYFCRWAGMVRRMHPCAKSNMVLLGGRGEFLVAQVLSTRGEEEDKKELEQRGSLFAGRRRIQLENGVLANSLKELEKKIEHMAEKIERNCDKVIDELRADHRGKERVQAERIEKLETELTRIQAEAVSAQKLSDESRKHLVGRISRLESKRDKLMIPGDKGNEPDLRREKERIQEKRTQKLETKLKRIQAEAVSAQKLSDASKTHLENRISLLESERDKLTEKVNEQEQRLLKEIIANQNRTKMSAGGLLAGDASTTEIPLLKELSMKELQDATDNFHIKWKFGESDVDHHEDVYTGKLPDAADGTHIKVKSIRDIMSTRQVVECNKFEADVVERLKLLQHPHLLTPLGVCYEESCLVYEHMAHGNVQNCIARRGENSTPERVSLAWYVRFRIMAEVARGLSFLHSYPLVSGGPIIHSAITLTNILLDNNFVAKIGRVDRALLGLPKTAEGTALPEFVVSNPQYVAPEYWQSRVFSEKTDIYAFGITLLEMLTGNFSNAFDVIDNAIEDEAAFKNAPDSNAGFWDVHLAREVASLALRCADPNKRKRPTMMTPDIGILPILEGVARKVLDLLQAICDAQALR
ncbi:hypothetical protein CBR_g34388 [Chara braunii]|uniref:Protein kinase domain-containing protein n=1 Tax=Chara braunii TaxID=69332 RepID=A0A388LIK2_CHABU|nr:hypothetical protein CBR_g34388 [Chara braunii]|eukprot:GBG82107.1 hypothetical protein CBR_g34388 [Chara braunii]